MSSNNNQLPNIDLIVNHMIDRLKQVDPEYFDYVEIKHDFNEEGYQGFCYDNEVVLVHKHKNEYCTSRFHFTGNNEVSLYEFRKDSEGYKVMSKIDLVLETYESVINLFDPWLEGVLKQIKREANFFKFPDQEEPSILNRVHNFWKKLLQP